MAELLIYGSYGYTGRLVARQATVDGLDPILAGRTAGSVHEQARELACRSRVFEARNPDTVADYLECVDVVLNCAGPFVHTADAFVEACIETGTHYLDITGEWQVFRDVAARDDDAADAGVMLLPGVGFDVVPSDCLAAHLHERLPSATDLTLALGSLGATSHGTATTFVEHIGENGVVREDGELVEVPIAHDDREIPFSYGDRTTMTIPWGDVVTAYYSTGIPNVTVYSETHPKTVARLRRLRPILPLLGTAPAQRVLKWLVDWRVDGPDEDQLEEGSAELWGEVTDGDRTVVSRVQTPNPYALTRDTALRVAKKALGGDAPVGFQTPSNAYGADLVLELDGVERVDVGGG
ncbi:saccharopine dehydrogenase family protein [Haloarchaeobius sp. HRN-SO-5]|uniref:saccharopine dehydrogenase family protein n=1 Tax=Haloarchaeobius sp. HRN-SO-5 TaxID=3446118 RepID=UPI003EBF709D